MIFAVKEKLEIVASFCEAKTAKEPEEKHRLEPYFNFGGREFFNHKSMKKYYWPIYFLVAIIISLYSQLAATKFIYFLLGSFITFLFFVGIYFCLRNILLSKVWLRVIRSICIIILLAFVYVSWTLASFSGFHSSYCYNLVAKDMFTGNIKVHCNFPPWHTTIIGGEEARKILLDNCLGRKSEFYDQHPDYCDAYKNAPADKDWTTGPNP